MGLKNLIGMLGVVGILGSGCDFESHAELDMVNKDGFKVRYSGSLSNIAYCLKTSENLRVFLLYTNGSSRIGDFYAEGMIGTNNCEVASKRTLWDGDFSNGVGRLPEGWRAEEILPEVERN